MEILGLVVLQVVIFGVVFVGLRLLFARYLGSALRHLRAQEQEMQTKAEALERRIRQLEADYHAKLAAADTEAKQLLDTAKTQATNIRSAAVEEAKHRIRQLLMEVETQRGRLKAELLREVHGRLPAVVCEALREILPETAREHLQHHLVQVLLDELANLTLRGTINGQAEVRSAFELSPAERQALERLLRQKGSADPHLTVQVDSGLLAGCVLRLGETIIDGSLKNRLMRRVLHG